MSVDNGGGALFHGSVLLKEPQEDRDVSAQHSQQQREYDTLLRERPSIISPSLSSTLPGLALNYVLCQVQKLAMLAAGVFQELVLQAVP